jgi:predicted TIM-barrel fold metal-dependent hydrolase
MDAGELEIVDSQIHLWDADTAERPWAPFQPAPAHGPPAFGAGDAIAAMDAAGVAAALLVPPSFEGDRSGLVLAASASHPKRFRALGRVPLFDPAARDEIAATLAEPHLVGVRLTFNGAVAGHLDDGSVEWFWELAAGAGVGVSIYPTAAQLPALAAIGRRHPRLRIAIDHLGAGRDPGEGESLSAIRRLAPLAELPNVAVKASALQISFPNRYSPPLVREVVDLGLSMFGPARVFWGSDLTRSPAAHGDYGATLRVFLAGLAHLPEAEARSIMGGGLREWFDWSPS